MIYRNISSILFDEILNEEIVMNNIKIYEDKTLNQITYILKNDFNSNDKKEYFENYDVLVNEYKIDLEIVIAKGKLTKIIYDSISDIESSSKKYTQKQVNHF